LSGKSVTREIGKYQIPTTLRLALAAALFALSTAAQAEKITLVCEPTKSDGSTFTIDIDYDRSAVILGGTAFPAQVTDKEVAWTNSKEVVVTYRLNRITAVLSVSACYGTQCRFDDYRCSRGKQQF
jgi:hypothetical protein